jgi:multidrug resistance efflux pump
MRNFFLKIKTFAIAHKVISAIIIIAVLGGGYGIYKKVSSRAGITRYVLSPATTSTIISSVTDSGQVSALNQVNINPTVSGALTAVYVTPGEHVSAGQALFTIDDTTAQKAVRDAQIGLQNAKLSLQKLQLQNSNTNLNASLSQAYDNGFTSVSNTFLDLPVIMNGITSTFFQSNSKVNNGQLYIDWYASQAAGVDQPTALTYEQTLKDSTISLLPHTTKIYPILNQFPETPMIPQLMHSYLRHMTRQNCLQMW